MGTPCPASRAALDQATAIWPARDKASDGLCASPDHSAQNPTSDHEPDSRGICHAYDLDDDPAVGLDVWAQFNAMIARRDPRVKYLIKNAMIWNPSIAPYWRPYFGSNPHKMHGHCSILTAHENDTSPWFPSTSGDITVDQADRIIAAIGKFEQDTRAFLDAREAARFKAAREIEGRRHRRLVQLIQDSTQGIIAARTAEEIDAMLAADVADLPTPEEAADTFTAEIQELAGALDDAVEASDAEDREAVDALVERFRSDLAKLADP
jgi:hypothetical protein